VTFPAGFDFFKTLHGILSNADQSPATPLLQSLRSIFNRNLRAHLAKPAAEATRHPAAMCAVKLVAADT
jgi:hypothetical protein